MEYLIKGSLEIISKGAQFMVLFVGTCICLGFTYVFFDLHFRRQSEFRRVFGKKPNRITPAEINNLIANKYSNLLALESKAVQMKDGMEKEEFEELVEKSWEKIQDMNNAAKTNGFLLSEDSAKIIKRVEEKIVYYTTPTA